jgi:DNA-binding HxlR family transcriptional regulator
MKHNTVLIRQDGEMLDNALRDATDIAGDRWVLLTIGALASGPRRFGDLIDDLIGIAPNVLIDRLRRMERSGLVVANSYSQRPRRYAYDLTESGRELAAILPLLSSWATRRSGGKAAQHDVCGTPLQITTWCPSCKVAVDQPNHDENLRWL